MSEMVGPPVTLKSDGHHELLVEGLWDFVLRKHGVDFDLELHGGRPLRAHRLILEVFLLPDDVGGRGDATVTTVLGKSVDRSEEDVVAEPSNERQTGHVDLNSLLLEFLYKGSVDVPQEQLDGLLQLATELNFKLLVEAIHHSKSDGGGRVRRQRRAKRPSHVESAADGQADPPGRQVAGGDADEGEDGTAVQKSSKRRKPRKSTPRKALAVAADTTGVEAEAAAEEEEMPVTRRTMPRRSAKFQSTILYDDGVIEDEAPDAQEEEAASSGSGRRSRRFGCPHCTYKTHIRYRMKMHVARHDSASVFRCKACPGVFLNAASLAGHRSRVHANDPAIWRCPHCEATMGNSNSLRSHLKVAHGIDSAGKPVEKRFGCEHCQESFVYKSHLDYHVTTKHTGLRQFRCTECSHSAFTMSELRVHAKFKHARERPHVCEVCGFTTVTMSNMIKHRRVHTKEKPFVCQCGKAYRNKESLNEHAVRHQEGYSDEKARTHMCHICGKGFLSRNDLMGHLRKVHHHAGPSSSSKSTAPTPKQPDTSVSEQLFLPTHSATSVHCDPDWLQ